jgi:hypothetical protein
MHAFLILGMLMSAWHGSIMLRAWSTNNDFHIGIGLLTIRKINHIIRIKGFSLLQYVAILPVSWHEVFVNEHIVINQRTFSQ